MPPRPTALLVTESYKREWNRVSYASHEYILMRGFIFS